MRLLSCLVLLTAAAVPELCAQAPHSLLDGVTARVRLAPADSAYQLGVIHRLANGCYGVVAPAKGDLPGGGRVVALIGFAADLQIQPTRWSGWEVVDQAPFRSPACLPAPARS